MLRCELSEEYFKRKYTHNKAKKSRRGTVVRVDERRGVYMVIWDGTKTAEGYHKDFLKIIT